MGYTEGLVGGDREKCIGLYWGATEGRSGDREKNEGERRREVSLWTFPLRELQQTAHWTVSR